MSKILEPGTEIYFMYNSKPTKTEIIGTINTLSDGLWYFISNPRNQNKPNIDRFWLTRNIADKSLMMMKPSEIFTTVEDLKEFIFKDL